MSDRTDWQAFSVELAENAKRNLDAKDDEITALRQQLAAAKEENERVRQANLHTMDVFKDMKAAKERAEARVAEYEALTDKMDTATRRCYLSGPTVVGEFKRIRQQAERAGGEK